LLGSFTFTQCFSKLAKYSKSFGLCPMFWFFTK